MSKRKLIYIFIFFLLFINIVLASIIFSFDNNDLEVVFFDVGQGDSILIKKGSDQILIDGGSSSQIILEKIGKKIPFWDRKIELMIATHPDHDHIGGLLGVMKNYKVEKIIDNSRENESEAFRKYLELINEKNIERLRGESGMNIKIGKANFEIFYPQAILENNSKDSNADSILGKLKYGKSAFLLTGDFPTKKEEVLFEGNFDISADILKIPHHGSKYSTSDEFLEKINPKEAIISVGDKNRYGHPSIEVLERLKNKKIEILRTDQMGDIAYKCKNSLEYCEKIN
jgi:competence protein ComEC